MDGMKFREDEDMQNDKFRITVWIYIFGLTESHSHVLYHFYQSQLWILNLIAKRINK